MPDPSKQIHAYRDDALGTDDAVGLRERLRRGDVTPRELVESAIARAGVVDQELRAIANDRFDAARDEAASAADHPGYFAGIPTFIKDNTHFAGMTTDHGSAAVRSARPTGAWPCIAASAWASCWSPPRFPTMRG